MELGLKGKTALVTGASKGIGLATAHGLAAEGCNVHLVARTAGDLDKAVAEIAKTHGVRATAHAFDLSDSASVGKLTAAVPNLDVLVNNAGAIPGGDILSVDEKRWREAWDLKVFGYINMCRAYYERMKAQGHGVIVNVVGLAGERPDFGYIAGSAGNASLMHFTKALGGKSLDDNIRVVAVNPGPVQTDRIVTLMRTRAQNEFGDPDQWQRYLSRLPLGRAATSEEVADLAVFLASERASYLSGVVYTIDGGLGSRANAF